MADSPVAVVKDAIKPTPIIKWFIGGLIGFALLDLFGVTDAVLRPVTYLKMKFAKPSA